ncbi:MAG: class I SAM-dependent methyltransferase, partial [Actinomycetota bacterium]
LDVRTGTLAQAGLSGASFDVVCLWDVLEHIPQIDDFLSEIRRILKPGGLLAVQSPNIASVMARQAGPDWSWLLLPHHVWHFTPSSMRATLERRGFAVERLYTWEPPQALIENLMLYKRHPRLGSKAVRRITDRPLLAAERLWCRLGRGGLVRAYARVPGGAA